MRRRGTHEERRGSDVVTREGGRRTQGQRTGLNEAKWITDPWDHTQKRHSKRARGKTQAKEPVPKERRGDPQGNAQGEQERKQDTQPEAGEGKETEGIFGFGIDRKIDARGARPNGRRSRGKRAESGKKATSTG